MGPRVVFGARPDINGPMWDEQAGPDGVNVDFCMAIGDGRTDEAVFKLLERGRTAITVAVGRKVREGGRAGGTEGRRARVDL